VTETFFVLSLPPCSMDTPLGRCASFPVLASFNSMAVARLNQKNHD